MPRGRTKSKLSLRQRRDKAFDLFLKGYDDMEVARRLKVTRQTANNYRRLYESRVHEQAQENPTLLREVLANTMRSLEELDKVRAEAWQHMEDRKTVEVVECEDCGHGTEFVSYHEVSDQSRTQYLNVLLKAQDQRSKLFGVIGVKAEMLVAVAQVKIVQEKIIRFMQQELDQAHRIKLERFLMDEMPELGGTESQIDALDIVDAEVIEDSLDRVRA